MATVSEYNEILSEIYQEPFQAQQKAGHFFENAAEEEVYTISDQDLNILNDLKKELKDGADSNRSIGIILGVLAFCSFVLIYYNVNFIFDSVEEGRIYYLSLNKCDTSGFLFFQLGVKIISSSLIGTVFYFVLKLCLSSFDQSERYSKRRHSLYGFKFLYSIDRHNRIPVDEKIKIIEVLNRPIESAHTLRENVDARNAFQKMVDILESIKTVKKGDFELTRENKT